MKGWHFCVLGKSFVKDELCLVNHYHGLVWKTVFNYDRYSLCTSSFWGGRGPDLSICDFFSSSCGGTLKKMFLKTGHTPPQIWEDIAAIPRCAKMLPKTSEITFFNVLLLRAIIIFPSSDVDFRTYGIKRHDVANKINLISVSCNFFLIAFQNCLFCRTLYYIKDNCIFYFN